MQAGMIARLAIAGALLAGTVGLSVGAANTGVLQVGAGDMRIVMGPGHAGLRLEISQRECPPQCGIDFAWSPAVRLGPGPLSRLG